VLIHLDSLGPNRLFVKSPHKTMSPT